MTTILIIDDDPAARDRIRYVAPSDWEILEAPDGLTGLEIARRERTRITLVVLDVELPDMEGRYICFRLRELTPSLPILPFTGHMDLVSVFAELDCCAPVCKAAGDEELSAALLAAASGPPACFEPNEMAKVAQKLSRQVEELVRKQRVTLRVAVYAASPFHRAALMGLLGPGVHASETTVLTALPKILAIGGAIALVSHADNFADLLPIATEHRVPLVLIAADETQALAVSVAQVPVVLLESEQHLATTLATRLEQLALGLPVERYNFPIERRRSKGHVVPTDFARRLARLKLRRRELDVVWLYYQGMEPDQAARVLGVEVSTVHTHWKNAGEHVPVARKDVRQWVDANFPEPETLASRP